jgi:hypothetical protein
MTFISHLGNFYNWVIKEVVILMFPLICLVSYMSSCDIKLHEVVSVNGAHEVSVILYVIKLSIRVNV